MPSSGDRFVDVFAGRGAVSWHVMSLLKYRRHWINALGTDGLFRALRDGISYNIPERNGRQAFDEMKRWAETPIGKTNVQVVHADQIKWWDVIPEPMFVATNYPWAIIKRKNADKEMAHLLEGYLCFSGGTYKDNGFRGEKRGGVSRQGYFKNVYRAKELLAGLSYPARITGWDYKKVLAECGPSDMVYLDPCYHGYDLGTYSDDTVDHEELVQLLLRARFKWVFSEYENGIYLPLTRAFGSPIRITVSRAMSNSNHAGGRRNFATECLWSNYDVVGEMLQSPVMDAKTLLDQLKQERSELDATITVLERRIGGTTTKRGRAATKSASASASTGTPKKKGRVWTKEMKKQMSERLKARWAARKKAAAKKT